MGMDHVATREAGGLPVQLAGESNDRVAVPTAIERAARRGAARNNAADSKLSDVSSLQVGSSAGAARCGSTSPPCVSH
jgi:hypothetical protein